jgi:hypothetical protein
MASKTTNRFSPEVRTRAVRLVFEHEKDHSSRWATVTSIAAKIGCTAQQVIVNIFHQMSCCQTHSIPFSVVLWCRRDSVKIFCEPFLSRKSKHFAPALSAFKRPRHLVTFSKCWIADRASGVLLYRANGLLDRARLSPPAPERKPIGERPQPLSGQGLPPYPRTLDVGRRSRNHRSQRDRSIEYVLRWIDWAQSQSLPPLPAALALGGGRPPSWARCGLLCFAPPATGLRDDKDGLRSGPLSTP